MIPLKSRGCRDRHFEYPPAVEQAILAKTQAKGISLDELVQDKPIAGQLSSPDPNELSFDQWQRNFKALLASHAGNTIVCRMTRWNGNPSTAATGGRWRLRSLIVPENRIQCHTAFL
jgi:hypothetical protein